jgi:hypothetical protein
MLICLTTVAFILMSSGLAEMPLGFTTAMNNGGQKDVLSVRNYDVGASLTEAYSDFEQLDRNTQVSTRSYGTDPSGTGSAGTDPSCVSGGLEASINSQVIGKAHIAWQSVDPSTTINGHHPLIGRSVEDMTGVFSIEKFIQLWSGSQPGEISVDWLPCS